jgi:hypothetical protein
LDFFSIPSCKTRGDTQSQKNADFLKQFVDRGEVRQKTGSVIKSLLGSSAMLDTPIQAVIFNLLFK